MAAPAALPNIRHISIATVEQFKSIPTQKIRTDEDVEAWRTTSGYRDYGLFLRRLNESVVGYQLPWSSPPASQATVSMLQMLDTLEGWIEDIPPLPTPQRFGNLAFRAWGKRLEERCETLLSTLLPIEFHPAIPHIAPYILTSFGSFTRIDYGTGHETSFALFLLCLTLLRFFEPVPERERELVLAVFFRYLRLCWKLQDVYKLEPAGSHGVWGLDDFSFLGYIFGSAQLRDQCEIPVSAILDPNLPPTNLYFLSISRIHRVKHGPFHEHSSQLYSIATGVQLWAKVNSGLFKMYEAEVLGKRVVVQHIPLGGLLEWDVVVPSMTTFESTSPSNHNPTSATRAPWPSASSPVVTHSISPQPPPVSSSAVPYARKQNHTGAMSDTYTAMYGHRSASGPFAGPLVNATAPLGPLSNTTLRPLRSANRNRVSSQAATTMSPPLAPDLNNRSEANG